MSEQIVKVCNKCEIEKELSCFPKDKTAKGGHSHRCKVCGAAVHKAWREANTEYESNRKKTWYAENKEHCNDKTKLWAENNKERVAGLHKEYYKEHGEEARLRSKEWYAANSDKAKARIYQWQKENKDKVKAKVKAWEKANPDKVNAKTARRRAGKKNATPAWAKTEFEEFAIKEMYHLANLRTKATGIEHHVDHIVPLNSEFVQGFHCLANLQILTAEKNISKSNKTWPDMW